MASLVRDLQKDILNSSKTTTEILRTAKLISAKLNLSEITDFINSELNGYGEAKIPNFRSISGGTLYAFNPQRGWQLIDNLAGERFPVSQPVSTIEELSRCETVEITPHTRTQLTDLRGNPSILNNFPQKISFPGTQLKAILEAIKNEIFEWVIELEKRGILGNDMSFDEKEKQVAGSQIFHIQKFAGIIGNVSHSNVALYDYSTLHQTLKEIGIPQSERNDLENIMDQLREAPVGKKQSVIDRAKTWITKNKEFLGASAEIVRKSLGLDK